MIYLKKICMPSIMAETSFINAENRTCFSSMYPFKIFPEKGISVFDFDTITILYGTNGSGKSTLINVLSALVGATRYSDFNDSPFFSDYVNMCYPSYIRRPDKAMVLTSDDVFDYSLTARDVNDRLSSKRDELFQKYVDVHNQAANDHSILNLRGIDDYARWAEVTEILSTKTSQSKFIKKRVARDVDLHSNGETAMNYFMERIDDSALYLLDEPENSLSIELQIRLADYIAATARATASQFIIATHSPILLSMAGAKIYDLDAYPARICNWTELPNVRRYFDFFKSHEAEFIKKESKKTK